MKLTGISVTRGMTINLGNHNFTKAEVGLSAEFEPTDDIADEMQTLSDLVTAKLRDELQVIVNPPKKKDKEKQTLLEGETA